MRIARRSVIKGLAAGLTVPLIGRNAWAQATGPTEASQIDVDKAKAEGKEPPPQAAGDPTALRAGPPRERELALLAAWRKSGGKP